MQVFKLKLTFNYCHSIIDLLTIQAHTPTPEPVKYDKTDGQWYTHDGLDVKDTQQRRGWFTEQKVNMLFYQCIK